LKNKEVEQPITARTYGTAIPTNGIPKKAKKWDANQIIASLTALADSLSRSPQIQSDHCGAGSWLMPVGSRPILDELPGVLNALRLSLKSFGGASRTKSTFFSGMFSSPLHPLNRTPPTSKARGFDR
jgi:hypothetical protein